MRFLIDRCAGGRLASWLIRQGHDVIESRTFGPDPGDSVLLQWAVEQKRVLVTLDNDFPKLVFVKQAAHEGMVRLPDVPADQRIKLMNDVLTHHSVDLLDQAIVTVRGNRIRISKNG